MSACDVYRYYDADGVLLYVGVSASTINRLSQHRLTAEWFGAWTHMTREKFSNRDQALRAEAQAILKEKPKYNVAGAVDLVKKKNPDIAPAIRRQPLDDDHALLSAKHNKSYVEAAASGCSDCSVFDYVRLFHPLHLTDLRLHGRKLTFITLIKTKMLSAEAHLLLNSYLTPPPAKEVEPDPEPVDWKKVPIRNRKAAYAKFKQAEKREMAE